MRNITSFYQLMLKRQEVKLPPFGKSEYGVSSLHTEAAVCVGITL